MINKATILGRIGKDPEIRMMQSGSQVASFSLATTESWKDKDGQKQEKTEWHKVVIFNDKIISGILKYVTKGALIYVEGQIQTRKYTDKEGQEKYTTEIVIKGFSDTLKIISSQGAKDDQGDARVDNQSSGSKKEITHEIEDDEIPF